ncbi:DUF3047 domain-containing protein [bacterium]|nr:DUF3047 domain-containing protein [bacterium]
MIRPATAALLLVCAGSAFAHDVWREEFRSLPLGWEVRTVPGTAVTKFRADPDGADGAGVLVMEADNASATFATQLKTVDLRRTPLLRWRWRVLEYPRDADGRVKARDDQAIAIYVSHGGLLGQRSIAYRWETDTPVGTEGDATYAAGIVKVHWIAVRNAADGTGQFHIDERNVAADFQRVFGFVPDDPIIAVTSNSQYTGSRAVAELDWLELAPLAEIRSRE